LGIDRRPMPTRELLDEMQWFADPLADGVVAELLATLPDGSVEARLELARRINCAANTWATNGQVRDWNPDPDVIHPELIAPLRRYLAQATVLPAWADEGRLRRAEDVFMAYGPVSVTILFCASLPECYVVPDLAAVLHATGQLEKRVDHRIRGTGAMIFPVMMKGGLTSDTGAGIAQVVKVRLIHAMVRNLILRDTPQAVAKLARETRASLASAETLSQLVPQAQRKTGGPGMYRALHEHGWDFGKRAMPNNQEELAYTLLTFSYVFLRALRRLGNGLSSAEERDYIHAWNVAGHVLGIREELMVCDMPAAAALFRLMQERGRADAAVRDESDSRARLAAALVGAMEKVMPRPFRAFPLLLTRRLLERASVRDLRLDGQVSWPSRILFRATMAILRAFDALVRLFVRDFSIARLFTRIVGYHVTTKLLMDQTRPVMVPGELQPGVHRMIGKWRRDPLAGRLMNRIEDRYTTKGPWRRPPPGKSPA
jgi:hypothetical protein